MFRRILEGLAFVAGGIFALMLAGLALGIFAGVIMFSLIWAVFTFFEAAVLRCPMVIYGFDATLAWSVIGGLVAAAKTFMWTITLGGILRR
ncbi:MAG: hypothetical protein ABSF14_17235 [Terriglobia bacterium]|jgi:hypothetical protein